MFKIFYLLFITIEFLQTLIICYLSAVDGFSPSNSITLLQDSSISSNPSSSSPLSLNHANRGIIYSSNCCSQRQQQQQEHESTWIDMSQKLNTIIQLIENLFKQTMERIDNMEKTIQTLQKTVDELHFDKSQINKGQSHQETIIGDNYPSILNKMYNIHQQTYQVCKDALVLPKESLPNCPTMSAICSMLRQYRNEHDSMNNDRSRAPRTKHKPGDLIISAGGHEMKSSSQKRQINDIESETDLDANAMREVFGMFANWTLDQYVSRMHRNVAEELNVFNFELKEKMQYLFEKFNKMDTVLHLNDQMSSSLLEIRDQMYEDHGTLGKIYNQFQKQQQSIRDCALDDNLYNKTHTMNNQTSIQIKTLFEEYFEKFANYLDASLPTIKSITNNSSDKVIDESSSSVKFVTYDTTNLQREDYGLVPSYKTIFNGDQSINVIETKPVFEPKTPTKIQKFECSRDANVVFPKSCNELRKHGATCNGVYVILTPSSSMKHVYCDMVHNDGGWTVILRRGKFSSSKYAINFDQNFDHYRAGFGDMHSSEFWIGLDFVHQMTRAEPHLLQIDLLDAENDYISMVYEGFKIGGLDDGYKFYVHRIKQDLQLSSNPNWNITDLASIVLRHNRTQFVTADHVNHPIINKISNKQQNFFRECASWFRSGWWYISPTWSPIYDKAPLIDSCRHLNLFHLMAPLEARHNHLSVKWNNWLKDDGQTPRELKYIIMKIRPVNRD